MENNAVWMVSRLTITKQELDDLNTVIDRMNYNCGDDGWIPSLRDVDEKLIGRYYEQAKKMLEISRAVPPDKRKMNECREELKRLWMFMYWIVETCLDMDPVAYERLSKFVDSKATIIGG